MDDETSIFDDLDNAEGVGGDPDLCQETEIIRPGPIKLGKQGHRRLFHHSQVEVEINEETEHKEACSGLVTGLLVVVFGLFIDALCSFDPHILNVNLVDFSCSDRVRMKSCLLWSHGVSDFTFLLHIFQDPVPVTQKFCNQ